jgi:hypothetical protein
MVTIDLHPEFMHAVTRYDRRHEGKRGYNPYALGLYMIRAAETCKRIEAGEPIREAIPQDFNDRLADHLLKWFGLPVRTCGRDRC